MITGSAWNTGKRGIEQGVTKRKIGIKPLSVGRMGASGLMNSGGRLLFRGPEML